jgi:inorganic triphosphatase YgiF
MPDPYELELKFQCGHSGRSSLRELTRIDDFRLNDHEFIQQFDLYYDTDDLALRRKSASIRIRQIGDTVRMTFKGPRQEVGTGDRYDHIVRRLEDEVEINSSVLAKWSPGDALRTGSEPSPLLRAQQLIGDLILVPIASIQTDRELLTYTDAAGSKIEIAIDDSTAVRLADNREISFSEVEIEVHSDDETKLESVISFFSDRVAGLSPAGPSKLQRTLE